ncbi:MAG: DEAD/DEAH box helicase [Crocinitomicaceae bacterium]|nr:DEAD/DEAH box helicase [Crocinitomicaceae bacterium]
MEQFSPKTYIKNVGFKSLMDIQQQSVDAFQKFNDVQLFSKTGSGKTLAFLLSVLSKLDPNKKEVQAIILAPSRELCIQINDVFRSLKPGYKSTVCYGGHSMQEEKSSLSVAPAVVIGTPGRLADHIDRNNLHLQKCGFLVIDEFDKCLEFGFNDDMSYITRQLLALEYKMLVSATKMEEIPDYIQMHKPFTIDNIQEDDFVDIHEHLVKYQGDLIEGLEDLLNSFKHERAIVFCNYREVAQDVSNQLAEKGITSAYYHGGLDQDERERALIKFRHGSVTKLICTDLGSRGLDIPEINHVIHYQYPNSEEAFVHRKGRTARMSASGNSYLFVGENSKLPEYVHRPDSEINIMPSANGAVKPEWETLYLSGGKKDKINKIDVVGFLSKKGGLGRDELGIVTVLDRTSYAAVKRTKAQQVLKKVKHEKVKGKKLKIEIAM